MSRFPCSYGHGKAKPLVSVGLPVHNGGRFVAEAIDSILGQSLTDLELIVSDNASTDGTPEIAQQYARTDSRVRYLRQPSNIGINRNFDFVLQQAQGTYFKWISASDYCARSLLADCCAVLESEAKAVLCFGRTRLVDERGRELDVLPSDFAVTADDPAQRFLDVSTKLTLNSPMNAGVIRRVALLDCGPLARYPSADVVLMAALALRGHFVLLPQVTYFRRTGSAYSTSDRTPIEIERLHRPAAKSVSALLTARRHWNRLMAVISAPLAPRDKLRALAAAVRLLYWDRRDLLDELAAASRRTRRFH